MTLKMDSLTILVSIAVLWRLAVNGQQVDTINGKPILRYDPSNTLTELKSPFLAGVPAHLQYTVFLDQAALLGGSGLTASDPEAAYVMTGGEFVGQTQRINRCKSGPCITLSYLHHLR